MRFGQGEGNYIQPSFHLDFRKKTPDKELLMDPVTRIIILDEVVGGPETQTLTQEQQEGHSEDVGLFAVALVLGLMVYGIGHFAVHLILRLRRWWWAK